MGIGGFLLLAALATCMVLYVRWAFALPIRLFEDQFALAALRASRLRTRGVGWRVGFVLLGWLLSTLLLGLVVQAGFRLFATAVLAGAGERPIIPILSLLLVEGGLFATLSFVVVAGHGFLIRPLGSI